MIRPSHILFVSFVGWLLASSCKAPLIARPPLGAHLDNETFVLVPRMPDVVQVQTLPAAPDDQSVWIDGFWRWSGRRWVWQQGTWATVPKGAYYAPPQLVRIPAMAGQSATNNVASVQLLYRAGHWHLADGTILEVEDTTGR